MAKRRGASKTKKSKASTRRKRATRAAQSRGTSGVTAADRRVAQRRKVRPEQVSRLRSLRGLSDAAFAKMPQGKLRRAVARFDYYDLPRAREAFRLLSLKDDQG